MTVRKGKLEVQEIPGLEERAIDGAHQSPFS
jgi:hypothetical protein